MPHRTITLTDRPPVKIDDDTWPLLAAVEDLEHDSQVEYQASVKSRWFAGVRQHYDGRSIVYAVYRYETLHQGARGYSAKRGVLLPSGADICAAVNDVCRDIAAAEHHADDADRWPTLAAECIADLPAEELS